MWRVKRSDFEAIGVQVDNVITLHERKDDITYDDLFRSGLVRYERDNETGEVTAYCYNASYASTIVDTYGRVLNLYADRHGLFAVDQYGAIHKATRMEKPRNSLLNKGVPTGIR